MKEKILQLELDPAFIQLQNLIEEPNIFKIAGRTHTERWHSAFWGWLFDKNGTHNLDDYVYKRLFALLSSNDVLKPAEQIIDNFFPYKELEHFESSPNEKEGTEKSIKDVGRFDIYSELTVLNSNEQVKKVSVIVEMKIASKIKSEQSIKYADWQNSNKKEFEKILIYFMPNDYLNEDSHETVGDKRWYCISYQLLHDNLLIPVLNHPSLSETAKLAVEQYVKNMRQTNKGLKMATTQLERKLIKDIYEKYQNVFETMFEVLQSENIIDEPNVTPSSFSRNRGKIAFIFDNKKIEGKSGPDVLKMVLEYIVDSNIINQIPLPWGTGTQRYVLSHSKDAVHPNGRDFFFPVKYGKYVIETHWDRNRTMKVISDIAKKVNVNYNLIEV